MTLSMQPYKGTRDFYPEDMRLRKWMFDKWRAVCEQFGYEEYDAPMLEPLDLYRAKTGDEIVNEQVYSFVDRGDREVAIRPEMTPSVSRLVAARRQELGYPLRWFSIPNLWRYEQPQRGRLREHWQLNADLFGVEGIEADIEIIQLADAIMKAFGAKPGSYEIRINSRNLLTKRIEESGIKTNISEAVRVIDAYEKMSRGDLLAKLAKNVDDPEKLLGSLENDGPSVAVKKVTERLKALGVDSIKPTETLARGFDYYTDIVFEVFDTNPENNRSMFGGGRYDGLVGIFGVEPVPTVGFGMGDVTLGNFLESNGLMPALKPATDVAMILIGDVYTEASKLAAEFRGQAVNISIDATARKLDKKIKSADKQGIRYVLFVGENELKEQKFNLKNLQTGQEYKYSASDIVELIKETKTPK